MCIIIPEFPSDDYLIFIRATCFLLPIHYYDDIPSSEAGFSESSFHSTPSLSSLELVALARLSVIVRSYCLQGVRYVFL